MKAYLGGKEGKEKGTDVEGVEEYMKGMKGCEIEKIVEEAEKAARDIEGFLKGEEKWSGIPTELDFEGHWEQKEGRVSGDLTWRYKRIIKDLDEEEEKECGDAVFRVEVKCTEKEGKKTVTYHETTTPTLHLHSLIPQTVYRFRVQVKNVNNSSTEWSGWSETLVTKAPSLPCVEGVTVTGLESGTSVVTWMPINGKVLYRVEIKDGEDYKLSNVVSVPRYELKGPLEIVHEQTMIRICPILVGSPSQPVMYVKSHTTSALSDNEKQRPQKEKLQQQQTPAPSHKEKLEIPEKAKTVVEEQHGAAAQHLKSVEVVSVKPAASSECVEKKKNELLTTSDEPPHTEIKAEKPTATTPNTVAESQKEDKASPKNEITVPSGLLVSSYLCKGVLISWWCKCYVDYTYVLEVKPKGEPDSAYVETYRGMVTRGLAKNLVPGTTYLIRVCAEKKQ